MSRGVGASQASRTIQTANKVAESRVIFTIDVTLNANGQPEESIFHTSKGLSRKDAARVAVFGFRQWKDGIAEILDSPEKLAEFSAEQDKDCLPTASKRRRVLPDSPEAMTSSNTITA